MREKLRDLDAALAVPLELERTRHERPRVALTHLNLAVDLALEGLSGVFPESWLRIEGVDLTDAAAHEERDNGSCARLEVGRPRCERVARYGSTAGFGCQQSICGEQVRQRESGDATSGLEEKIATGPEVLFHVVAHGITVGRGTR